MATKRTDNSDPTAVEARSGKADKGAGTRSGGVSGGKATGGADRKHKGDNPRGKGSGNR